VSAAAAAGAVALALLSACAAGLSRSHASQAGMPCSEAEGVASAALVRLGYTADVTTAPRAGAPGTVVGHRVADWNPYSSETGPTYTVTVTITCSNQGAQFDAVTDEPVPESLSFKSDFAGLVEKVSARRPTTRPAVDHAETGLVIGVEPLRGGDAAAEFGSGLSAAGITPVRLKLDNRTDRTYRFAAARVQLVTQEGERVEPLADGSLAQVPADLRATMRQKQIGDGQLTPHAVLSGFLYFPASAYRRATLVLIDEATDEEEGFSVEF
jgi:hypothetical protein